MNLVSANPFRAKPFLVRAMLLGVAAAGLGACVATEPVGYYPAQSYYYSPGYYYAPRPAYQSYTFVYRDDDDGYRRDGGHRGHDRGYGWGRDWRR